MEQRPSRARLGVLVVLGLPLLLKQSAAHASGLGDKRGLASDHDHDHEVAPHSAAVYPSLEDQESLESTLWKLNGSGGTKALLMLLPEGADEHELAEAWVEEASMDWHDGTPLSSTEPIEDLVAEIQPHLLLSFDADGVASFTCSDCQHHSLGVVSDGENLVLELNAGEPSASIIEASVLLEEAELEALLAEQEPSSSTSRKWVNMLLATISISLIAPIIIVLGHLGWVTSSQENGNSVKYAFSFAAGNLMAASLIHLVPEGLMFIDMDNEGLEATGWKGMSALLGGFFLSLVVSSWDPHSHSHSHSQSGDSMSPLGSDAGQQLKPATVASHGGTNEEDTRAAFASDVVEVQEGGTETTCSMASSPASLREVGFVKYVSQHMNSTLADEKGATSIHSIFDFSEVRVSVWNLTAGDCLCNLADGMLIGAAALSCSSSVVWTVAAGIAAHEVTLELADYFAYMEGRCTFIQALMLNSLSALMAVAGGCLVLLTEEWLTSFALGIILLFTAGLFVQISTGELLPAALQIDGKKAKACCHLAFIVGAVLVSLPMLLDVHCDSSALGSHGHADHASH